MGQTFCKQQWIYQDGGGGLSDKSIKCRGSYFAKEHVTDDD